MTSIGARIDGLRDERGFTGKSLAEAAEIGFFKSRSFSSNSYMRWSHKEGGALHVCAIRSRRPG